MKDKLANLYEHLVRKFLIENYFELYQKFVYLYSFPPNIFTSELIIIAPDEWILEHHANELENLNAFNKVIFTCKTKIKRELINF